MKAFDIAFKDLTSAFRSTFALSFMFVIPMLVTGMFYLMFGNSGSEEGFSVPVTKVVIANLDQGSSFLDLTSMESGEGIQAGSMGEVVVTGLQDPALSDLIDVALVEDENAARKVVDSQEAGAAIIIPGDFSSKFASQSGPVQVELYSDPTLTIGPAIVKTVLQQFLDEFSGARIAVEAVVHASGNSDPGLIQGVIAEYLAGSPGEGQALTRIEMQAPNQPTSSQNQAFSILSLIMAGMMVFFAFFTGTSTAQTILSEDEKRTLPRLFTTPTRPGTILSGKFLSAFLTVMVQITVLLAASSLIFGIQWGEFFPLVMIAAGTICAAGSFGIFVNSLLKSTRQGGVLFGGILTVTGMIGMIQVFTYPAATGGGLSEMAALLTPQGWAVRGLIQSLSGSAVGDIALTAAGLFVWSAVFFALGSLRFQRRYL